MSSFAWNAAFDEPQKVFEVVQGTSVAPVPWTEAHPAGSVPGGTPLNLSVRRVVAAGAPVSSVVRSVAVPSGDLTISRNRIGLPASNELARRIRNGSALTRVPPAGIVP